MHFLRCESIPAELKSKVATLETFHMSNRGGRKQYWDDSAKRSKSLIVLLVLLLRSNTHKSNTYCFAQILTTLFAPVGMVDTQFGIHFGRDPSLPLPPYVASSNIDEEDTEETRPVQEEPEYYPLVLPEDRDLITDYLYLAMEQMQPCE
jgi:hypothetical protein